MGPTEVCDGAALAGETCLSQGFTDGTLACAPDCLSFDTSGCTTCGDGILDQGFEQCDGQDFGGDTCEGAGFDGGTLSCSSDCQTISTSDCTTCGDGVVEGAEQCDPNGTFQCTAPFNLGNQVCNACILDQSLCSTCGDGLIEGTEICDGANLGGETCLSNGFFAGSLSCDPGCLSIDTSGCTNCGDGVVDPGEDCDGTDGCDASCTCDAGLTACGGLCVDITTDVNNCGACGNACDPIWQYCNDGFAPSLCDHKAIFIPARTHQRRVRSNPTWRSTPRGTAPSAGTRRTPSLPPTLCAPPPMSAP